MIGRRKKEEPKKEIRRKNISPVLADVRHPSSFRLRTETSVKRSNPEPRVVTKPEKKGKERTEKRFELKGINVSRGRRSSLRFSAALAVMMVIALGGIVFVTKENIIGSVRGTYNDFQAAISAAKNFDAEGVKKNLAEADSGVKSMEDKTSFLKWLPFFKEIPGFIGSIRDLNKSAFNIIATAEDLKSNGATWIWSDGDKLVKALKDIKAAAANISSAGGEVRNKMATVGMADGFSGSYLLMQSEIFRATDLLDGLIGLLDKESYVVVFFMNDSEMRATGGFIGSYAVVKLSGGEINDISVNDIYYPDKFLDTKVIPPSPMQAITADWEARDANWFFDFPTSASKVLNFFELSSVYADKGIKFKGAIAMNHKVVTDMLRVTGPIELPEYKMVLDETNFLETVQDEVARDSDTRGGERKNVLKSLLPEVVNRIKAMSSTEKKAITDAFMYRLKNKDIQLYFTDDKIENFAVKQQWAGDVYNLPDSTFGDYLAVVDTNLGGEKTDAYMRQKISLSSSIDENGYIRNEVDIARVHNGKNADKAFYRVPNQSYIRILTPKKSQMISATGATNKKVVAKKDYVKEGYASDQDVLAFESGEEAGKKVFGYWLTVIAGATKTLSVNYERPGVLSDNFRFVYEKQSGVDSALSYRVEAPPGYIFKETGTSEYVYDNETPPTRLIIDLTITKL
ncbi:MAG: DUF4012 domain-containing protein [Candidatus Colwellbacteria bacterium]|nr:DUF4012 domain-containing protein [Candidatus Colwellbacteria bacterium]